MSVLKIIVKPTHRCNLNCWYCYDKQYHIAEDMDLAMVETIAKFAVNTSRDVWWIWHGGEPLMMPLEFYMAAHDILNANGIHRVSMQTNGTLLDEPTILKFRDWNWSYSISFDGATNDLSRGNTQKILSALLLSKTLYRPVGIIKTVTETNVDSLVADYDYIKPYVSAFDFNRVFQTNTTKSFALVDKFMSQYHKLFDKWSNDPSPIMIRPFAEHLNYLLGKTHYLCSYSGKCLESYICVNPNGDLFPCDCWYPDEFCYGNISEFPSYEQVHKTNTHAKLLTLMETRKASCQSCDIFDFCHGGCNASAILTSGGIRPESIECEIRKKETYYLREVINNLRLFPFRYCASRTEEKLGGLYSG